MKRVYLDNAAATPVNEEVEVAIQPFLRENFANPSAIYKEGMDAKKAVEDAREVVGRALRARPNEVIFTSGGTESDNLAILGTLKAYNQSRQGLPLAKSSYEGGSMGRTHSARPHVITSVIEHPAVLETCKALEVEGVEVTYVGVDEFGIVNPKDVRDALRENTILVSIMYANNEIGTVQSIREIAKVVRGYKKHTGGNFGWEYPYLHTDACQAVNYLDMDVVRLGVDMLTLSSSKIYGPKGSGVLFLKKGTKIVPIVHGGGQEYGARSGTENVVGVVGVARAIEIAEELKEKESARLVLLRDYFIRELLEKIDDSVLNGDALARLPNNVNISIPNIDSEQLVIELDAKGVCASASSACQSSDGEPSRVIIALEEAEENQKNKGKHFGGEGSVRFSLGRDTTKEDIGYVLDIMPKIIAKITIK